MVPVEIAGLVADYGGAPVLGGVDLAIRPGELFFLLGPSGCGKTTLLRSVAGFVRPRAGAIRIGGEDVTALPPERRGLGMVFQHYALWPHLDVAGNVAFGLEVQRAPAAERAARVEAALAQVSLAGLGARRVGELSGGQQQRVALARAIVVRPRVLLLDEPLSNLDARLRAQLRTEIRRVCKAEGLTAIYVTHDQAEALAAADRLAVLDAGRVLQVGAPGELYDRPSCRAVAAFLGEANLVPATVLAADRLRLPWGEAPAVVPAGLAVGAAVTACIRPERLRLGAEGVAGAVESVEYRGATAQVAVRVGEILLQALESPVRPRAAGDVVTVAAEPGHLVALGA